MRERDAASGAEAYVTNLFTSEDDALQKARKWAEEINPNMMISPREGKLLQVLLKMVGAKRVVEIGAFTGYSAIWMARALGETGKLWTFELNDKHAKLVEMAAETAGLSGVIDVIQGPALENLDKIKAQGPFDAFFIDADKGGYFDYLQWAKKNLRSGGIIIGDNTYLFGAVHLDEKPDDVSKKAFSSMKSFNKDLADDPDFTSILIPTLEGMTLAVKN